MYLSLGTIFDQNRSKFGSHNHQQKRSPTNIEFDTKGIPKWNQNRCPNSSKINAETGNEKDHENYRKSCFSEW